MDAFVLFSSLRCILFHPSFPQQGKTSPRGVTSRSGISKRGNNWIAAEKVSLSRAETGSRRKVGGFEQVGWNAFRRVHPWNFFPRPVNSKSVCILKYPPSSQCTITQKKRERERSSKSISLRRSLSTFLPLPCFQRSCHDPSQRGWDIPHRAIGFYNSR